MKLVLLRGFSRLAAGLTVVSALSAGGQQQASTLRVNTRLVVLDVSVTDAKGQPVDGLTAKDFRVLEDGEPQAVVNVEAPGTHALPAANSASDPQVDFPIDKPAAFGNSPVTILLLDQINTEFADSGFAKHALQQYLKAQPAVLAHPAELLCLQPHGLRPLTGFTRDRAAIEKALEKSPTAYPWALDVDGKVGGGPIERLELSLRGLEALGESTSRIAGRKDLIWVGGGYPSLDPDAVDATDMAEARSAMQHVTNVLLDTRVTVYAIDPKSSASGMTEITDATQMMFYLAAGDAVTEGTIDPFSTSEDFDRFGPLTGGRVIRGRNDVSTLIGKSIEEGGHYYTLAYRPDSESEKKASFRNIRVEVLRPGLTASTRVGYYTQPEDAMVVRRNEAFDLNSAAESPLEWTALHVVLAPVTMEKGGGLTFDVHIPAADLVWTAVQGGDSRASLAILAVTMDDKGNIVERLPQGMTAQAGKKVDVHDPGRIADFHLTMHLNKHAHTLRLAVMDNATGKIGTAEAPLR